MAPYSVQSRLGDGKLFRMLNFFYDRFSWTIFFSVTGFWVLRYLVIEFSFPVSVCDNQSGVLSLSETLVKPKLNWMKNTLPRDVSYKRREPFVEYDP